MKTYPFELTALECIYLSDVLSMFAPGPPGTGEHAAYPDLLLKVLSALLESKNAESPVIVPMSQAELWMVREVAKSSVSIGSEKVGLNLLMKAARGLLAVTADADVQTLVSRFGETYQQEPGKDSYENKLRTLKSRAERGGDLGAGDDDPPEDDPDHSASR